MREGAGMKGGQGPQLDPICGRRLEEAEGQPSTEYKKRQYYFCSEGCRVAFQRQTERFRVSDLARAGALMTPGRVRWGIA